MYTVSTIAGGQHGYQDGGVNEALFSNPCGLCVDSEKNIYIADYGSNCIRWITPQGQVSTLAWDKEPFEFSAEDSIEAGFHNPTSIILDGKGDLIMSDRRTIQRLSLSKRTVTTIAGSNDKGRKRRDGVGKEALFNGIEQICMDTQGFIYCVELDGYIRKISPNGEVQTIHEGLLGLRGIAVNQSSDLYVCESFSRHTISRIDRSGTKTVIAGGGSEATFATLGFLHFLNPTTLVCCDRGNKRIHSISIQDGRVNTLAGFVAPRFIYSKTTNRDRFSNEAIILVGPLGITVDNEGGHILH